MDTGLCSQLSTTPVLSWAQFSQQKHSQNMSCCCSIADSRSPHVMTNDIDIMLTTFNGLSLKAHGLLLRF